MKTPKTAIPKQEDLKRLPRFARVLLLARAVRRIQPLYLEAWAKAPAKFHRAIEAAIAMGEVAASQGKTTPGLNEAGLAAMEVYGNAPDKITFSKEHVDEVPFAAARVAFAARENDALFADEGFQTALSAVEYFEKSSKRSGLVRQFAAIVGEEFKLLARESKTRKWKSTTPMPPDLLGPLWPDGPPLGWPTEMVRVAKSNSKPATNPRDLRIPKDLVAFLQSGARLKYSVSKSEVGPIRLKTLENLVISSFTIDTDAIPERQKDPNRGKDGHYSIRAVDLVDECDAYGPEGILAWLPDYRLYGQWDPDHQQVIVFPKTTWADIVAKPARYLDAQWNDWAECARHVVPWKHGKFSKKKV